MMKLWLYFLSIQMQISNVSSIELKAYFKVLQEILVRVWEDPQDVCLHVLPATNACTCIPALTIIL